MQTAYRIFPWYRFGPYFCQPVIAGLGDNDEPFICTMDCIGAKYVSLIFSRLILVVY